MVSRASMSPLTNASLVIGYFSTRRASMGSSRAARRAG
jgi:hypothetical protein